MSKGLNQSTPRQSSPKQSSPKQSTPKQSSPKQRTQARTAASLMKYQLNLLS